MKSFYQIRVSRSFPSGLSTTALKQCLSGFHTFIFSNSGTLYLMYMKFPEQRIPETERRVIITGRLEEGAGE